MKKLLFIFGLFMFALAPAQQKMKDYKHILKSKSIYEIDAFLKDAHPDDPRRAVLKPRLMGMIKDYIKKAHPKDQRLKDMQEKLALLRRRPHTKISFEEMNEIIKQKQIAKYKQELAERQSGFTRNSAGGGVAATAPVFAGSTAAFSSDAEEAEFKMLMNTSPEEHKRKTVHILNKLFDNDPSSDETIVLVNNKSDCNIIVRIEGANNLTYRLPVATKSENSMVVKKGEYIFSSLVCGAQYASQKTLDKSIMVALDNPKK